jgi:hypothetical protein
VDHTSRAAHLTSSDCKGFLRTALYPMQWIRCEMAVKRMGMLRVSVRKMKALTVKMETVILISKDRENLIRFVYYMHKINSKTFFLGRTFTL